MARYKYYNYDQLMMVPVSLEEQLIPGTLECAIHHVVEERLDMSMFDDRYRNDETGRKAIDPKVLIKIVLFGYSLGLISSRSLERACKENITFMLFPVDKDLITVQSRPLCHRMLYCLVHNIEKISNFGKSYAMA
ncbi:MAG: transposase [Thermodesulfobacteriota bacterium]|nr:transposase [Thermodesulfobacteriota bacterium]MEA3428941.1 transposase [Thermodesulfobacteriota bacterium]